MTIICSYCGQHTNAAHAQARMLAHMELAHPDHVDEFRAAHPRTVLIVHEGSTAAIFGETPEEQLDALEPETILYDTAEELTEWDPDIPEEYRHDGEGESA